MVRREEKPVDLSKGRRHAAHRVPGRAGSQSAARRSLPPARAMARGQSAQRDRRAAARAYRSDPARSGRRCAAATPAQRRCRLRRRARPIRRRCPAPAHLTIRRRPAPPRRALVAHGAAIDSVAGHRAGAAPAANAPLSLSPDANNAPPPVAQEAFAAAAAARIGAADARIASAPPPRRPPAAAIWCRCRRSGARPTPRRSYPRHPVEVPSVLGGQPHSRPPRRSRHQGHLLPRHGRAVRQPRRGGPALQQPEAGRRRLRCAALS